MAAPENYKKLGTVGTAYKGEYQPGKDYKYANTVYFDGSTYIALKDNPDGNPKDDRVNWMYLARGGDGVSGGTVISVNGQTGEVNLSASDVGAISKDDKGVKGGIASLGEDGKVPKDQLPDDIGGVKSVNGKTGDVKLDIPTKTSDLDNDSKFVDEEIIQEIINRLEPVGKIIAYMGTTAPENYLACDGQVYDISEYPILAEHIKTQFGRYDYWGGNGETTFAVKNLQGEFLRGAGTNGHEQGSGAVVGEHQDGTGIPAVQVSNNAQFLFGGFDSGNRAITNIDKSDRIKSSRWQTAANTYSPNTNVDYTDYVAYTPRPTNTSVLFCIKYQ